MKYDIVRHARSSGECDVAVVGGGFAGVAAALAARRNGARVSLVERYAALGGLGTLGNVVIYLALCDGLGHQVSFGLVEELMHAPEAYGPGDVKGAWTHKDTATIEELKAARYEAVYHPGSMEYALERKLVEAGVDLCYDTLVTDILRNSATGAVKGLVLEDKCGCSVLAAKTVVDASGDADLCVFAGEDCEVSRENHLAQWSYLVGDGNVCYLNCWSESPEAIRAGRAQPVTSGTDISVRGSITRNIIDSRKAMMDDLAERNRKAVLEGRGPSQLFALALTADVRMTRRLVGLKTIVADDVQKWTDDAVGIVSDWRKPGPVYCIPYGSLVAQKTPNLLATGRCMSSTGDAWQVTRCIPQSSVTGEAAGTAAAMVAKTGGPARDLDVSALQARLRTQGVRLDPELLHFV